MYRSILRTEGAADAPDGQSVVRVLARHNEGEYSIDDFPDTMESSVGGRRYRAAAWVKGTRSTDGQVICIGVRERTAEGELVSESYAGQTATSAEFRELGVVLIAEGSGNRIDVHVFTDRAGGERGDAFLADAISLAEAPGGTVSGGAC